MHIVVLSGNYPYKDEANFVFVANLVRTWADLGHHVDVICPQALFSKFHLKNHISLRPKTWEDATPGGNTITVHRALYQPTSNKKSSYQRELKAICKVLDRLCNQQTVLYAHFWKMGLIAATYGAEHGLPTFVASGESAIDIERFATDAFIKKASKNVTGAIAVSTKNAIESETLGLYRADDMLIAPNAVNETFVARDDKEQCRKELGLPQDALICLFVGAFNNRKGIKRLCDALKGVVGVSTVFLGTGSIQPEHTDILFSGRVSHEMIPAYMGAADFFVLPTLAEGCCNAVVEALACGLPVISSDLPFNHDILNAGNSIMVDPANVNEIREAIIRLRDDPNLRESLSHEALATGRELKIEVRAQRILDYMQQRIG